MNEADIRSTRRPGMQHLKKCPECHQHSTVVVMEFKLDSGTPFEKTFTQVRCKRCNISTPFFEGIDGELDANDAWNKRVGLMCDTTLSGTKMYKKQQRLLKESDGKSAKGV